MFTVIIPLYNKAHTIKNTLASILSQTYSHFEVLIVNDGSTDNGLEVIRNFTNDSRVRILNQENQGVSAARNKGVAFAIHEHIAFMDGDDEWLPGYLSKMKESIERFPHAGMYCCAGVIRDVNTSKETPRIAKKYEGRILEIDFFENPHIILHTSATVVKKSMFNKTGGFPLGMKRNQDYALFFSLALIAPVVYCGLPLSVYMGGVAGQATNTPIEEVLEHVVKRFNVVFYNKSIFGNDNRTFYIFMKYELRHMFITHLRMKDFKSNHFLFNNLNQPLLETFPSFEIALYKQKKLRVLSVVYLLLTKMRWRLRGYPRVNY